MDLCLILLVKTPAIFIACPKNNLYSLGYECIFNFFFNHFFSYCDQMFLLIFLYLLIVIGVLFCTSKKRMFMIKFVHFILF